MINKVIHIKGFFRVLNVILLIVFSNIVYAQTTVTISDTAFFNVLKKNIPQVIDANNKLIIAQAKAYTGDVYIKNVNIQNIDEIKYFESITKLTVTETKLSVFPSISSLKNLEQLSCYTNKLTQFPDISSNFKLKVINCNNNNISVLPALSGLTNLQGIEFTNNKVQSIPLFTNLPNLVSIVGFNNKVNSIASLDNLPNLNILILENNELTSLDKIYNIQTLTNLNVKGNKLNFTELNKLKSHPSFSSFFIFPQDTVGTEKYVQFFNLNPKALHVDNIPTPSEYDYDWYKNGIYLKTINGVDSLNFTNLLLSDTGKYTCVVKCINSNSPYFNKTITYNFIHFEFSTCKTFTTFNYNVINKNCKTGTDIEIEETFNLGAYGPYNYTLVHDSLNQTLNFSNPKFLNLSSGVYSITIEDINKNCKVNIPSFIKIDTIANCITKRNNNNEYFTPDGDGINDDFYIDVEGVAHVYNRNGMLIKTIKTPATWDGTDNNGNLQDLGYYVIVLNNKQKIFLTLMN
jgi:gliding motility-associated-like protein